MMKLKITFVIVLAIFALNNCKDSSVFFRSRNINGIFVDFNAIEKVKKQIRQKDENFLNSLQYIS